MRSAMPRMLLIFYSFIPPYFDNGKDVKNMKKMRKIMLQRAEKPIKISRNKKRGRYILDEFNLLPPSNIRPIYVYDGCHNLDHILII